MYRRLAILLLLLIVSLIFAQAESHLIIGGMRNSGGTYPDADCITFRAWLAENPDSELTQVHVGSVGLNDSTWSVNVGNLPGLDDGDTLVIEIVDTCTNEAITIRDAVDTSVDHENWGTFNLVAMVWMSIRVQNPNGGEFYLVGEEIDVEWTTTGTVERIDLEYSSDNGVSWNDIALNIPNSGHHMWVAPGINSTQCLVRATVLDTFSTRDVSDAVFTITEPSRIDLEYPVGGETFYVGNDVVIEWSSTIPVTSVNLWVSYDDGWNWESLATGQDPSGTFTWTVPDSLSDECFIKAIENGDSTVFDVHEVPFAIETLVYVDDIPPAYIPDLEALDVGVNQALLGWHSPGDDSLDGTATTYDIRYSEIPITEANWNDVANVYPIVGGIPAPLVSGTGQNVIMTGLLPVTHYYVAMKTADEIPNWSGLSNVVDFTTEAPPDEVPPNAIHLTVVETGCDYGLIRWVATGDDGVFGLADHYDFRISDEPITEANYFAATPLEGIPDPAISGTTQEYTILGLDEATHYYIAARVYDEASNASFMSNIAHVVTDYCDDVLPPGRIFDLSCNEIGLDYIEMTWIAPGEDGFDGFVDHYTIRVDTEPFTFFNWRLVPEWASAPEGSLIVEGREEQSFVLEGLESGTLYYIAVAAYDDDGNVSELSNVTACYTSGILDPAEDITVYEDTPDFYLPPLDEIFVMTDMSYIATSTTPEVTLIIEDDEESLILEELDEMVRVSVEENYFGESWIILQAYNDIDTVTDSIYLTVIPVDDAPTMVGDFPDSFVVEGVTFRHEFDAEDVEGDSIIWVLINGPDGFEVRQDGTFRWDPGESEGHFDIAFGLTDPGCADTNVYEFPLNVIKLSHEVFRPQRLIAHDGFASCIPVTWDLPECVELGLPVTLTGYTIYRSLNFEYGYEPLDGAIEIVFNSYGDCAIDPGISYYYRVKAHYLVLDTLEVEGGFSNIDAGIAMLGNVLYSQYSREYAVIDGVLNEELWNEATYIEDIHDGVDLYIANSGLSLYMAIVMSGEAAEDGEFHFAFDEDWTGTWTPIEGEEGWFSTYDSPVAADLFTSFFLDSLGIVNESEPVPAIEMASAWLHDDNSVIEMSFDLDSDSHLFARPGDTMGIALNVLDDDEDNIFQFPIGADGRNPSIFATLVLGAPGGSYPILVPDPILIETTCEADWYRYEILSLQNVGEGVGIVDAVSDDASWLSIAPLTGVIFPGTEMNYIITIDGEDMTPGDYETEITFYTNDPSNPEIAVPVAVTITPYDHRHYYTLTPPRMSFGNPGDIVEVPIVGSEVYDNDITSMEFIISCDDEQIITNGYALGDDVPADWDIDSVYMRDDRVFLIIGGDTPIGNNAEVAVIRYIVAIDAIEGASSLIEVEDFTVNDDLFEIPVPLVGNGVFVIGERPMPMWDIGIAWLGSSGTLLDSIHFGLMEYATDYYDRGIDGENLLPLPGFPDAYFVSRDLHELRRDIRHWGDTIVTWMAVFDGSNGWLKWDPEFVWEGTFIDDRIDMSEDSLYHVSSGDTVWFYYYHNFDMDWNIELVRGWNMLSFPCDVDDATIEEIFPTAIPPVYVYNPMVGYEAIEDLEPGKGFWVLSDADTEYVYSGYPAYRYELDLNPGWNLIGGVAQSVNFWEQTLDPEDAVLDEIWSFLPAPEFRYERTDWIEPGKACWAFAFSPAELTVSSIWSREVAPEMESSNVPALNMHLQGNPTDIELRIVNEEPVYSPVPPSVPGVVSRIAIDGEYCTYDHISASESWFVDVSVNKETVLELKTTGLYDYIVEYNGKETLVSDYNTINIEPGVSVLKVYATDSVKPNDFGIASISPNPANASFAIDFAIVEESDVNIDILDISGRKVVSLLEDKLDAGSHSVRFENSEIGSGIYLVRLRANGNETMEKLILMK